MTATPCVARFTGSQSEITHAAERVGDVKHLMAALDKIRAAGFVPKGSLPEGLKATVEFFKKRCDNGCLEHFWRFSTWRMF